MGIVCMGKETRKCAACTGQAIYSSVTWEEVLLYTVFKDDFSGVADCTNQLRFYSLSTLLMSPGGVNDVRCQCSTYGDSIDVHSAIY
jgi:hypothetical protein